MSKELTMFVLNYLNNGNCIYTLSVVFYLCLFVQMCVGYLDWSCCGSGQGFEVRSLWARQFQRFVNIHVIAFEWMGKHILSALGCMWKMLFGNL